MEMKYLIEESKLPEPCDMKITDNGKYILIEIEVKSDQHVRFLFNRDGATILRDRIDMFLNQVKL